MTFVLDQKSRERLQVLHPAIEAAVLECADISEQPFTVFEGMRTLARQKQYVAKGVSKTMKSYHLVGLAVDLVPLIKDKNGKPQPVWDVAACRVIAAAMARAVARLKQEDPAFPSVTWGGSWKWFDGPHFQLDAPYAMHARTKTSALSPSAKPAGSLATGDKEAVGQAAPALSRESVRTVQLAVNTVQAWRGHGGTPEDGVYGALTERAVATVQKFFGVKADGVWGPATQDAYEKWRDAAAPATTAKNTTRLSVTGIPQTTTTRPPLRFATNPFKTPRALAPLVAPRKSWSQKMQGKKTYLIAVGAALAAAGAFMQDQMTLVEFVSALVNVAFAATIRNGIASTASPKPFA